MACSIPHVPAVACQSALCNCCCGLLPEHTQWSAGRANLLACCLSKLRACCAAGISPFVCFPFIKYFRVTGHSVVCALHMALITGSSPE